MRQISESDEETPLTLAVSQESANAKQYFGRYMNQFSNFNSWSVPKTFFSQQKSWIKKYSMIDEFNFITHLDKQPKNDRDTLVVELVCLSKPENFEF